MSYAEAKIADARERGDQAAVNYWTHVKAMVDACAPLTDGQRVELRAVFAVTPKREAPMTDTQQDTKPLPTRREPLREMRVTDTPLQRALDRVVRGASDAPPLFSSSI